MPLLDTDRELTRDSYYAATAPRGPAHPPLQGEVRADVGVVGGGLAGLSAALELAERGLDVVLLEAQTLGFGASGRNGGQAIHGLACDQSVIEAQLGQADARRVWDMTIEALDLMRDRIARHAIDCEWQAGYLGLATSARKGRELAAWADRIERVYGYPLARIGPAEVRDWINDRGAARYQRVSEVVIVDGFPRSAAGKTLKRELRDPYWAGRVDITMNRAPDFGRLPGAPQVLYLQGFSGHGLALTGLAGRLAAEAIAGDAGRFDLFARLRHRPFPGGPRLRTPALVLGMAWYRMRDLLG